MKSSEEVPLETRSSRYLSVEERKKRFLALKAQTEAEEAARERLPRFENDDACWD